MSLASKATIMAKMNMQRLTLLLALAALGGIGLIGLGVLMALPSLTVELDGIITPSQTCTVGIVGTAASITLTGLHAQSDCERSV